MNERAFLTKLKNRVLESRGLPVPLDKQKILQTLDREQRKLLEDWLTASESKLGLRPTFEQQAAGVAMFRGYLIEMATGEGKTLAAVLSALLFNQEKRRVRIFTANDYLAKRDAMQMSYLYHELGRTVSFVTEESTTEERKKAYRADICYLTLREAGFDYLRDDMCYFVEDCVQTASDALIIDEADSLLIDEARIPLVIAGNEEIVSIDPQIADRIARTVDPEEEICFAPDGNLCILNDRGENRIKKWLEENGLSCQGLAAVNVSLQALHLLKKEVDYLVTGGRVLPVDENTGRASSDRKWPFGLHNALHAKEGLECEPENRVYRMITIQDYLATYVSLAGMTATAVPVAGELLKRYGLKTTRVSRHSPLRQSENQELLFIDDKSKWQYVIREAKMESLKGRPVLIAVLSIKDSEETARKLQAEGLSCHVLNAHNAEEEAHLIAEAGRFGRITVATPMAGRGTDILLGGGKNKEREKVISAGGLHIIRTQMFENRRIEDQLEGRNCRQGEPGSVSRMISLEDPLIQKNALLKYIPRHPATDPETGVIIDREIYREISRTRRIMEYRQAEVRCTLEKYSFPMEKQRQAFGAIRRRILEGGDLSGILQEYPERLTGEAEIYLRRFLLDRIDRFWSEHLELSEVVKEGIHLQRLGRKDPLLHYINTLSDDFSEGFSRFIEEGLECCQQLLSGKKIPDTTVFKGPTSLWTYLQTDDPFSERMRRAARDALGELFATPFHRLCKGWETLLDRLK